MAPRRPVPPDRTARPADRGHLRSAPTAPVRRPAQPRRPAARPAASGEARPPRAPRPRGGAPGGGPPVRPPRRLPVVRPLTMMSGVLVILALLIAPYVRPYLAQRSQLAEGKQELIGLQREVDALQAER